MSKRIDIHELIKHEIFSTDVVSCNNHFEKNRPCPSAVYGVSDQYLILDSLEKIQSSKPSRGEYQFNFMIHGVTRSQTIGVIDSLDTIIGIQIFPFSMPIIPKDNFTVNHPGLNLVSNGPLPSMGDSVSNPQAQTPFGRITLLFKELGLQSISDANDRRHHFEFVAKETTLGDRLALTPICDVYHFTEPIQAINGLTVCLFNPIAPLRIPPDVLYNVRIVPSQLLTFMYSDPTFLINLALGDRIYIYNFQSHDQALNSYIGRASGHIVGVNGFIYNTTSTGIDVTFRLNPDVDVGASIAPHSVNVLIAKNRIRIPLRLRRVVPRLTNYIAP